MVRGQQAAACVALECQGAAHEACLAMAVAHAMAGACRAYSRDLMSRRGRPAWKSFGAPGEHALLPLPHPSTIGVTQVQCCWSSDGDGGLKVFRCTFRVVLVSLHVSYASLCSPWQKCRALHWFRFRAREDLCSASAEQHKSWAACSPPAVYRSCLATACHQFPDWCIQAHTYVHCECLIPSDGPSIERWNFNSDGLRSHSHAVRPQCLFIAAAVQSTRLSKSICALSLVVLF